VFTFVFRRGLTKSHLFFLLFIPREGDFLFLVLRPALSFFSLLLLLLQLEK
jgi:hypothetical protein